MAFGGRHGSRGIATPHRLPSALPRQTVAAGEVALTQGSGREGVPPATPQQHMKQHEAHRDALPTQHTGEDVLASHTSKFTQGQASRYVT